MYDCILEVVLPNNEIKQYELWDKFTNTKLKNTIFSTTENLKELNPFEYEFLVSKEEKLQIDFYKYIMLDEIKERVDKGLPVKLFLIRKGLVNSPKVCIKKKNSTPNISFPSNNNTEHNPHPSSLPLIATSRSSSEGSEQLNDSLPELKNALNILLSSNEEKSDQRSRSGSLSNSSIPEPPKSGRRRAGTSSSSTPSPLSILSPRSSSSSSLSSPLSTSSPQGRFKSLFKSHSGSKSAPIHSKSMTEIKRRSGEFSNLNSNNNSVNEDGEEDFIPIPEIYAPPEEAILIAQNQFGYHFELGLKSLESLSFESFFLEIPKQENLYSKYFVNKEHKNYAGEVDGIGPVFASVIEEKDKKCVRGLIRIPQRTYHICFDSHGGSNVKSLLSRLHISIPRKNLKRFKNPELIKELEKFDQSHIVKKYKFGVLYCKEGQKTEEEWFSNEHGSNELYEFMDILGTRITLKDWDQFRGGLDVHTNTTGLESYYTQFVENEIMFHVSTLLPYSEADEQKIERKRHLGNDIVVIIFKEGNTPFIPSICKSVFNHCYIVVSKEGDNHYRVEIAIKDGVKSFGPSFPSPSLIPKELIRDFLLTKMLNAEWAAYRSLEFSHKFKRTRSQQLSSIYKSLAK